MSQTSARLSMILLVEPDDIARPVLKENLQRWGYAVIVTLDAADALQRTKDGQTSFDLILLDQFKQAIDETIAIGQYIRQQAAPSSQMPIVVMAERYGVELEGQDIQMGESEYVTYLETGEQLKNLLYQLCPIQSN